ncbi:translation elongation factor Ts [Candidatus Saccharibacteria bacterium]|nr:translation elongation factor Ts [Candidatus Saccharibacteria bacterium]
MAISIDDIKKLREMTGAGMMKAKEALEEAQGDIEKAQEILRVKGMASADKKADRTASAGMIGSYVHGGRIGVLVEVNCETDFVVKTDDFQELVEELSLHIAAINPQYVSRDDVPADVVAKEKALFEEEVKASGKPAEHAMKIVEGKLDKWLAGICLLEQPFYKDDKQTIEQYVKSVIGKLGENIVVRRFVRLELGQ